MKFIYILLLNLALPALITLGLIWLSSVGVIDFKSQRDYMRDFYLTENAVHVSPHSIRKMIMEGKSDFVLVDLRSAQEYEKEHVTGAINIPAYIDPNTSVALDKSSENTKRILKAFQELPKDKEIIVYCYSIPCMTGRKVGQFLVDHGMYVKHLGIGWNEWRYFWTLWNHDAEEPSKWEDYVSTGSEPGVYTGTPSLTPCVIGEFGC